MGVSWVSILTLTVMHPTSSTSSSVLCMLHTHFFQHRAQSPCCSSLAALVGRVTLSEFGSKLCSIFPGGF